LGLINTISREISDKIAMVRGDSLKAKSARGVLILGVGTVAEKGLAFLSKVVLTYLLAPEFVGVAVVIFSLTALFEVMTEVGVKQSVIHSKRGEQAEYLNMAWWFQAVRACGLYLVAFFVTPLLCNIYFEGRAEISAFYDNAELILLIRVAFLSVLFNGFISPGAHVLEKKFKFGRSVFLIQGSGILGAILTITLVFFMRNVWAIVIGFSATAAFRCLFSFILCPIIPRFAFDRESVSELFRFARGMFGSPILAYFAFHADILVAGKLVAPALMAYYGMAKGLSMIPRELFMRVINPVLFSAFSEKQDDKQSICRIIVSMSKYVMLLAIPVVVLEVICSKTILKIIYPDEYVEVAIAFGILCICTLFLIQGVIMTSMFFGIGHPGKHRAFVGLRAFILLVLIYPAVKVFGLNGAACSVLIANIFALSLQVVIVSRAVNLKISDYILSWFPGVGLSAVVLLAVLLVRVLKPGCPVLDLSIGLVSLSVCITAVFFNRRKIFSFIETKATSVPAVEVGSEQHGEDD